MEEATFSELLGNQKQIQIGKKNNFVEFERRRRQIRFNAVLTISSHQREGSHAFRSTPPPWLILSPAVGSECFICRSLQRVSKTWDYAIMPCHLWTHSKLPQTQSVQAVQAVLTAAMCSHGHAEDMHLPAPHYYWSRYREFTPLLLCSHGKAVLYKPLSFLAYPRTQSIQRGVR